LAGVGDIGFDNANLWFPDFAREAVSAGKLPEYTRNLRVNSKVTAMFLLELNSAIRLSSNKNLS
jgi:hypothetical protein